MKDLLIFPFGGNAKEAIMAIDSMNRVEQTWNVLGFLDDDKSLWGKDFAGYKVLGGVGRISEHPASKVLAVPGSPGTFLKRKKIIESIKLPRERWAAVVDGRAAVSPDAWIGENCLIMANVVISASVRVGAHCVILPNTVIAHDSIVGDYTMIGSNVSVSGSCTIGPRCYIGSGATIRDGIQIGMKSLVGLAACVVENVPEKTVVAGHPARPMKKSASGAKKKKIG